MSIFSVQGAPKPPGPRSDAHGHNQKKFQGQSTRSDDPMPL